MDKDSPKTGPDVTPLPAAPSLPGPRPLEVLLATEGTYPFHRGGVSTWADVMGRRMPDVRYTIFAVVMNPFVQAQYELPSSITRMISLPLWGTQDPSEHRQDLPFSQIFLKKQRTTPDVVGSVFMPLFSALVGHLVRSEPDPAGFGETLIALYRYFQVYDYEVSFKSGEPWLHFREQQLALCRADGWPEPTVFDMVQALGWVYRFLTILNTPVPAVDLSHSSAAAFCGVAAIIAKLQHGAPYLLTEHGVYLREQYLSIGRSDMGPFARTFLIRLVRTVVSANLHHADEIAPVCHFNGRWEQRLGADPRKIRPVYNGVDPNTFDIGLPAAALAPAAVSASPSAAPIAPLSAASAPGEAVSAVAAPGPSPAAVVPPVPPAPPVRIVSVARMDPNKDIETLLRAAALVHTQEPRAVFRVQGAISVPEYHQRMLQLRADLGLQQVVEFAEHSAEAAEIYRQADIVLQSSVSEAFPYAVIEGMMTGRLVIATDVGGTAEALGDTGLLVPSREPALLADALLRAVRDPALRLRLGSAARARALALFAIDRTIREFSAVYRRLARITDPAADAEAPLLLALQRAWALARIGRPDLALPQVDAALLHAVRRPAVLPAMLALRAQLQAALGHTDAQAFDLVRARLVADLQPGRRAAG